MLDWDSHSLKIAKPKFVFCFYCKITAECYQACKGQDVFAVTFSKSTIAISGMHSNKILVI